MADFLESLSLLETVKVMQLGLEKNKIKLAIRNHFNILLL